MKTIADYQLHADVLKDPRTIHQVEANQNVFLQTDNDPELLVHWKEGRGWVKMNTDKGNYSARASKIISLFVLVKQDSIMSFMETPYFFFLRN